VHGRRGPLGTGRVECVVHDEPLALGRLTGEPADGDAPPDLERDLEVAQYLPAVVAQEARRAGVRVDGLTQGLGEPGVAAPGDVRLDRHVLDGVEQLPPVHRVAGAMAEDFPAQLRLVPSAPEEGVEEAEDRRRGAAGSEHAATHRNGERSDSLGPQHRVDVGGRAATRVDLPEGAGHRTIKGAPDGAQGLDHHLGVVAEHALLGTSGGRQHRSRPRQDLQLRQVEHVLRGDVDRRDEQAEIGDSQRIHALPGPDLPVRDDEVEVGQHRVIRTAEPAKHLLPRLQHGRRELRLGHRRRVGVGVSDEPQHRRRPPERRIGQRVVAPAEHWQVAERRPYSGGSVQLGERCRGLVPRAMAAGQRARRVDARHESAPPRQRPRVLVAKPFVRARRTRHHVCHR